MRQTFVSGGSNTRILSGSGHLYRAVVSTVTGGSLVLADAPDLGATPNLNSKSLTSTFAYLGPFGVGSTVVPVEFGIRLQNGLVLAATSSASVTVVWDG